MMVGQGDQHKADYLIDCSVVEFYYRMTRYKAYSEAVKKQMDDAKNRKGNEVEL